MWNSPLPTPFTFHLPESSLLASMALPSGSGSFTSTPLMAPPPSSVIWPASAPSPRDCAAACSPANPMSAATARAALIRFIVDSSLEHGHLDGRAWDENRQAAWILEFSHSLGWQWRAAPCSGAWPPAANGRCGALLHVAREQRQRDDQ